ncbi:MAG TPA: hypothetical protein VF768_07140 [Holophagaceae bacterium]
MDITSAGSLALLTYQTGLVSGSPSQALQQAFQAATSAGSQVSGLVGGSSDASLLSLSTQPPTNLATYQLAAQSGMGAASIQSIVSTTTSPDLLLAQGMNSGSMGFPVVDPNVAAAWSSLQYAQSLNAGQTANYTQQAAALAVNGSALNLMA